jgi:hypothetical protein
MADSATETTMMPAHQASAPLRDTKFANGLELILDGLALRLAR